MVSTTDTIKSVVLDGYTFIRFSNYQNFTKHLELKTTILHQLQSPNLQQYKYIANWLSPSFNRQVKFGLSDKNK